MIRTITVLIPLALAAGGCIQPSSGTDAQAQILDSMPSYSQYGWVGGAANGGGSGQATYFPITSMIINGDQVTFTYAWQNGIAEGAVSGTWAQSNGHGPQQLVFDEQGQFISGWWADSSSPSDHHPAFLLE